MSGNRTAGIVVSGIGDRCVVGIIRGRTPRDVGDPNDIPRFLVPG